MHTSNLGVPGAEKEGIYRQFQDRSSRGWQSAIGWVNPIGSNLVTEFTASIWKFGWLVSRPLDQTNWPLELGYDDGDRWDVFLADGSRGGANMVGIRPTGYTPWNGATESPLSDWGLGAKYTASWIRGDHYLKFGIEHTRNLDVNYHFIPAYGFGRDNYDGFATGQIQRNADGSLAGVTFGESWADFYLGLRWEQPREPFYEGDTTGRYGTDYYSCAYDFSQANGRIDPAQMMPRGFDIAQWQGPDGIAVPFANLGRRGCYENKWRYFAPRLGLAWRMFGTNQTVLRAGVGLTYDQEFGILRARVMRRAIGQLSAISDRGFETPTIFTGSGSTCRRSGSWVNT